MRSVYPFGKLGQLLLVLYLGSLLFSWPVGALFGARLDDYAGASLFLQRLEGQPFDPLFLAEFLPNAAPLKLVSPLLPPLMVGYFLFHVFFAGGAMYSLAERRGPFWASFWQGFMKFGSRFLLLNLIFLSLAAVTVLLIVSLFHLVQKMAPEPAGDMAPLYIALLQGAVIFTGVGLLQSMHYVIRARWVLQPRPLWQMLRVPLQGNARFLLLAAVKYLVITLLGFGLAALVIRLAFSLTVHGVLLLVLLQLAVLCTVAGRIWLYAEFVKDGRRQLRAEEERMKAVPPAANVPVAGGGGATESGTDAVVSATGGAAVGGTPAAADDSPVESPGRENRPEGKT
ncbi:MAG: hypothetical protein JXQ27_17955 [Acidobacteria bacterium]|nr:hypothetical protein [Acidobacteriota bacterium]